MKFRSALAIAALFAACGMAFAHDSDHDNNRDRPRGMITVASPYPVAETMQRLVNVVVQRNFSVPLRVDHAAAAANVGLVLRPTQLLVFGKAEAGTPLMQCSQTIGIDLPLKALVWQDDSGKVWLAYNDIRWLARRHDIRNCPAVETVRTALQGIMSAALAP